MKSAVNTHVQVELFNITQNIFLFFDAFWGKHILGGVVLALCIEVDFDDFPWNVFAFETSIQEVWDLSFDEHFLDAFSARLVFSLQKLAPWGKVAEGEDATNSQQAESMRLSIL